MKIYKYSSYEIDRFFVVSDSRNFSNVWDKLIRLTAKLTESYAGDIYFEMAEMGRDMEDNRSFDKILLFHESGVTCLRRETIEKLRHNEMDLSLEIQQWEIIYDAKTQEITLTRVTIR